MGCERYKTDNNLPQKDWGRFFYVCETEKTTGFANKIKRQVIKFPFIRIKNYFAPKISLFFVIPAVIKRESVLLSSLWIPHQVRNGNYIDHKIIVGGYYA